jgi:hypothetical protein
MPRETPDIADERKCLLDNLNLPEFLLRLKG